MKRAPRILAVDDQPANLALIREILEQAGFEVVEARSGTAALALAQEIIPDLILLDMHLPDVHGLDVLRRLRESSWGAGLRVAAMSAMGSPDDHALWLEAGCVAAIPKPLDVRTFVQTISQWLPGAAEPPSGSERDPQRPRDRLGDILVANMFITEDQLEQALRAQAESGKRLGQILVERGHVSEDDVAWALSNQLGYPYVYLTRDIIDDDAARLLPDAFLRERRVFPILRFDQEMTLAMADPTDQRTVDEVADRTGLRVKRALALGSNIEEMLDRLFSRPDAASRPAAAREAQHLQFHLVQAIQQHASEIHFDPAADGLGRVRYRLQGVLVDRAVQPTELHNAILAHLRALTGAGDAVPTTAAASVAVADAEFYLRAAFLPTTLGPAATVAFYPCRTDAPDLGPVGVPDEVVRLVRETLAADRGVFLVGCDEPLLRSTLLHALISPAQRGKIWTLETLPVHRRPTLSQTALRSADEMAAYVRGASAAGADLIVADDASGPDALLACCEAGRSRMVLAGHPQGDVVGALGQTLDAVGAALVASALRGILAARAIRLLCPTCKEMTRARTFAPRGCEVCGFTGFRGHRALVEVWIPTSESRSLLLGGQIAAAFEHAARAVDGQRLQQARALVEDGLTSTEEIAGMLGDGAWTSRIS
jgi:type IV pilus assembly protein PilB